MNFCPLKMLVELASLAMLIETFSVIFKHRELVHKQVREKDESNLIDYGLERPLKKGLKLLLDLTSSIKIYHFMRL